MKKYFCFLICAFLLLTGCGTKTDANIGKTVFDTEKEITGIEFYTTVNLRGTVVVPEEYLAEITEWLGTFKITEKNTRGTWAPGTGSTDVTIYYADGTTHSGSISNTTIDGVGYYIDGDNAPDFWPDLFNTEDSEDE